MADLFAFQAEPMMGTPAHEPPFGDSLITEYVQVTMDGTAATLYAADQDQDDKLKKINTIVSVQVTRNDSTAGTSAAQVAAGGKSVLITATTLKKYFLTIVGYAQ